MQSLTYTVLKMLYLAFVTLPSLHHGVALALARPQVALILPGARRVAATSFKN